MSPTKAVLAVIETISLLVFTLFSVVFTLKTKKKRSTNNPYNRAKIKVKDAKDIRHKAVKKPPTIATWVPPILFSSKAPKARSKAWTPINILSMGEGTTTLDKKIIAPKRVAKAILFVLGSKIDPSFTIIIAYLGKKYRNL